MKIFITLVLIICVLLFIPGVKESINEKMQEINRSLFNNLEEKSTISGKVRTREIMRKAHIDETPQPVQINPYRSVSDELRQQRQGTSPQRKGSY